MLSANAEPPCARPRGREQLQRLATAELRTWHNQETGTQHMHLSLYRSTEDMLWRAFSPYVVTSARDGGYMQCKLLQARQLPESEGRKNPVVEPVAVIDSRDQFSSS